MARRDPDKSARNRIIKSLDLQLRALLPGVLAETGLHNEMSLNATIGSLHDEFFDLKHDLISSDTEFANRWLRGLKNAVAENRGPRFATMSFRIANQPLFRQYFFLFLKRSFLRHCEEWTRMRPHVSASEIWIGQNKASYGLLITPRFQGGNWENDKSEIRAFKEGYWTIGHVLTTGLVIPGKERRLEFSSVDNYLTFFTDTLVRGSGSPYEYAIAEHYAEHVRNAAAPREVPLLIPEYRYLGLQPKHEYRLDFMVVNPYSLARIGFELSPWSTHGLLVGVKAKTQAKVNEEALENFEKEMAKLREYFRTHSVFTLIFTDKQLIDCKKLFDEHIRPHLQPEAPEMQLSFEIMEEYLL